jgi:hypothetical protein
LGQFVWQKPKEELDIERFMFPYSSHHCRTLARIEANEKDRGINLMGSATDDHNTVQRQISGDRHHLSARHSTAAF